MDSSVYDSGVIYGILLILEDILDNIISHLSGWHYLLMFQGSSLEIAFC